MQRHRCALRAGLLGVIACLATSASAQPPITENFDAWSPSAGWSTVAHSNGWTLVDGQIKPTRGGWVPSRSAPNCAFLHAPPGVSAIQSPTLADGAEAISFYASKYPTGVATSLVAVQVTTNLLDWETLTTVAVTSDTWTAFSNIPGSYRATAMRLSQVGAMPAGTYAGFDDITVQLDPVVTIPNPVTAAIRQLMPASRRTPLTITEIMYHPPDATPTLEFIEIFNTEAVTQDIGGFRLSGDVDFRFPTNATLGPRAFVVVARDPAALAAASGQSNITGPLTNALPDSTGRLRLHNEQNAIILDVSYEDTAPWPASADGAGHALLLTRPDYGEGDPRAWSAGALAGGSPGTADPLYQDRLDGLVINEFLAHTDLPDVDFIELFNSTAQTLDISGCWLSDTADTNKFRVPIGTLLPPGGHIAWTQAQLGFSLSSHGDNIILRNPRATRVLDAVNFAAQPNGVATGRHPDGAPAFHALQQPTPGITNAPLLMDDIVINEIMYSPISGNDDDEFVELHNRGTQTVSLANWRFTDGIEFAFPPGTTLAPGGHLVVARNAARLIAQNPQLNAANTLGDYGGQLSDRGERLALARPDNPALPYEDLVLVDEVSYADGWGDWTDGGGSSLELTDPRSDNRLGPNWAGSDETQKAAWTTLSVTGLVDNGSGSRNELQITGLHASEFLIDNVELIRDGEGVNRIVNSTFEGGIANWILRGNHARSTWANTGFASAHSLHVRATDRGDINTSTSPDAWNNHVATTPASVPTTGERYILRAKARWLCGFPAALMSLQGFWLDAPPMLEVPPNLGTPGLPNSRLAANVGPAIEGPTHSPLLPAAAQGVKIECRIHDPDGIAAAWLAYRVDPATNFTSLPLRDDGTGGDTLAGDGRFAATIPGQSNGVIVAWRVSATDAHAAPATSGWPTFAAGEALVRFGNTASTGVFGTYRLWMTAATQADWNTRETHNNEPLPITFVCDGARAIPGATGRYRGGWRLFDGPAGPTMCAYALTVPKADRFLGDNELKLDLTGQKNRDTSRQVERFTSWVCRQLGHPYANLRIVNTWVNGTQRQPLHDYQTPALDFVQSWFPDEEPAPRVFKQDAEEALTPFISEGRYKASRYRNIWRLRNPRTPNDDLDDIFAMVSAFNLPYGDAYLARTRALANTDGMVGYFAVNHVVANQDSWGYVWHHNASTYFSHVSGAHFFVYDADMAFENSSSEDPFRNDDPVTLRVYNHPFYRRAYWRVLKEAVAGPLDAVRYNALFDELDTAMTVNNVAHSSPAPWKSWLGARRSHLLTLLPAVSPAFAITSNGGADFATNAASTTLTGLAPVEVADIRINGASVPLTFPTVTNWSTTVALTAGPNPLTVAAYDRFGALVASDTITVTATVPPPDPAGWIVISEIMYHAPAPNTDFLELFNRSPTETFSLAGLRINGVDFTFPAGTFIGPRQSRVIAENLTAYTLAYTNAEDVIGVYAGDLDNGGERLSLQTPGLASNAWQTIDTVLYDDDAPWPAEADGSGQSLQLLDPDQDNDRAGNWGVSAPAPTAAWQFRSVTGVISNGTPITLANARFSLHLQGPGNVRVDDLTLVTGTVAAAGENLLTNGNFESALADAWSANGNHGGTFITATNPFSGAAALCLTAAGTGAAPAHALVQNRPLTTNMVGTTLTLGYWFHQTADTNTLTVQLTASGIIAAHDTMPVSTNTLPRVSPGTTNTIAAQLPPFPRLWIAELMASNNSTTVDNLGERAPWLELFNAETNTVALADYFITDNLTDLRRWAFPPDATIGPGERLLVWLDGEPGESAPGAPHTSFAINSVTGSVALTRGLPDRTVVVDYMHYGPLAPDTSFGAFPDDDPAGRMIFHNPSPGQANSPVSRPVLVRINEWLPDNTMSLPDPADGRFQDWFELYNPDTVRVHLGGFGLTDRPATSNRFLIPGGTWIEPDGFLLIWADSQPEQNQPGRDLHVDFSLSKDGETIALFAPDGSLLDAATFGPSASDVSAGLWPDGEGEGRRLWQPTPGSTNRMLSFVAAGGTAATGPVMQWPARIGRRYLIEHRHALTSTVWQADAIITANTPTVTFTDTNATGPFNRFYRLTELP